MCAYLTPHETSTLSICSSAESSYRSRCPGESIHPPVRRHCWSAGSCDPASWPPPLWPPRHSSEPAAALWQCSTWRGPLGPAGGCTRRAVPLLWRHQRTQELDHWLISLRKGHDNTDVASAEVPCFTARLLNRCCTLATVQSVIWLHLLEHFPSLQLPEVVSNGSVNDWRGDSGVSI